MSLHNREQGQLILVVAHAEEDFLRAFVTLLFQLYLEPIIIQSFSLEIIVHHPAVHDDLRADVLRLGVQLHVLGIERTLCADREDRELAVVFKDGSLDIIQIEVALLTAQEQELAQLELCFLHVFAIQFAVVHDDRRRAVDKLSGACEPPRDDTQSDGNRAEHQHRDCRFPPRLVQRGRQLRGDGADGDARDVVEELELCDLLVPDDLCNQKQDHRREQRREDDLQNLRHKSCKSASGILFSRLSRARSVSISLYTLEIGFSWVYGVV